MEQDKTLIERINLWLEWALQWLGVAPADKPFAVVALIGGAIIGIGLTHFIKLAPFFQSKQGRAYIIYVVMLGIVTSGFITAGLWPAESLFLKGVVGASWGFVVPGIYRYGKRFLFTVFPWLKAKDDDEAERAA